MNYERKYTDSSLILELEKPGYFSGYGAVFSNIDHGGDRIHPGAFAKFIQAGVKPKLLLNHGRGDDIPVGVIDSIYEDDYGLKITAHLISMESDLAVRVYSAMKAMAMNGLSIGYRIIDKSFTTLPDGSTVRELKELELPEISIVTFPMNDQAVIQDVKNDIPKRISDFEGFLRDAGFTRRDAKLITSKGYKAYQDLRDAGEDIGEGVDSNDIAEFTKSLSQITEDLKSWQKKRIENCMKR